jgi:hypothetical protein
MKEYSIWLFFLNVSQLSLTFLILFQNLRNAVRNGKDMVYTFNIHSCSILSEIEAYISWMLWQKSVYALCIFVDLTAHINQWKNIVFDFFFKCFTIIFNFSHFISESSQCCTKWGCRFGTGLSSQRCWCHVKGDELQLQTTEMSLFFKLFTL